MKTLLVPVDFSDATTHLLQHAADLAKDLSARLVLLHISEPVATYVPVGASMDVLSATPPPLEIENTKAQQDALEKLAEPLETDGLEVDSVALIGLAVDDILEQADRQGADMIVLGSHGHGALYHLFSGSVVTGVLRRAKVPVVVIPVKKKKA
jgi:nucleotide-binding universal stress UspA family protein